MSIYYDSTLKYWFFSGQWWIHKNGSSSPTGHPRDQFFKIKINIGNQDELSTVIIDNVDTADSVGGDKWDRTEVLTSNVIRLLPHHFQETLRLVPKSIEDVTKCNKTQFRALIQRFCQIRAQQNLQF